MPTIDILGVPHTYDLTAPVLSNQVLVFIHGWLLSRGYWQPLIERLAPDYQCLSYDLRGFGSSQFPPTADVHDGQLSSQGSDRDLKAKAFLTSPAFYSSSRLGAHSQSAALITPSVQENQPESEPVIQNSPTQIQISSAESPVSHSVSAKYTAEAYARDLTLLLKELKIANAWLIGHSLGGSIALWGAVQFPDVIRGVICLNAGGGIYLKEEFEKFRSAGQQLLKLRPRWLCHLPLIDLIFTRASVARPIDRCWGRQRVVDFVMAHPEAALGALLDTTTEEEVHKLPKIVSQIRQPVYFLTGSQDEIMEPKYVRHLASFHPMFQTCGENVFEIEKCGHMSMVEQPDAVAQLLRSFLTQHSK